MEVVTLKEAQELYDQEKERQEMLNRLEVIFAAVNDRIRTKNVTYHWMKNTFDVNIKGVVLTQDDLDFICEEYISTGGFPLVLGAANTVLRTATFTFYLEVPETEATDDDTVTNKTIV